ncbi:nucleotidyltransferase family protein [Ammonifex thiophilus]|nr:nucleotidyltransferase family protein [Ammonifex thiophilus]
MRTLEEIRTILQEQQVTLAEKYGIRIIGLFGSYVRGEQQAESDLDVLVEILRPISLLELVGAELYLGELLGMKVDLVPRRSLREELKEAVMSELVAL